MMQERRNAILQELNEYGKVKVADLSKKLECSEVTIRNDIKSMDKEGLLKRTHGGAIRLDEKVQRKYSAESIYRNTEKKRQIAACAYAYIEIPLLSMIHPAVFILLYILKSILRKGLLL